MTTRLNPYLNFPGTTRRAMEFYQSVLGGDLTISTFAEYGGAPEGLEADNVMHAQLETPSGFTLMAADSSGPGGSGGQATSDAGGVSLSLSGEDGEELRRYWEGLSSRGSVTMPLEKQMWGDEFCACRDRFGVEWMVNISAPQV